MKRVSRIDRAEARLLTLYAGYYNMQINPSGVGGAAGLPGMETSGIVGVESKILASPAMREILEREGAEPGNKTLSDFAAFLEMEVKKWRKVLSESGVRAE